MKDRELVATLETATESMDKVAEELRKWSRRKSVTVVEWGVTLLTLVALILSLYLLFTGSVVAGIASGLLFFAVYVARFTITVLVSVAYGKMTADTNMANKLIK